MGLRDARGHVSLVCTSISLHGCAFFVSCFSGLKRRAFQPEFVFYVFFSGFPGAPASCCNHGLIH